MSENKDFVDSWQFRTAMVGALVAAFGIPVCFVGVHIESKTLCAMGMPLLYAGDALGFFGIAAGVATLGWNVMQRRRARNGQGLP